MTLTMQGDWGAGNLTKVCGWLAQEFIDRAGPDSGATISTGRGMNDAVLAVGRGRVQLAVTTPVAFVRMAIDGVGPFRNEKFPYLRAIGTVPQNDRLVVLLAADLGITSFEELRTAAPALRIAGSPDDGTNWIGLAAHKLMEVAGIDDRTLASWGGAWIEDERPFPCLERYASGEADAVVHEAIMAPHWERALERRPGVFLEVERTVLDELKATYGWPSSTLAAGWFQGQDCEIATLDYRDFLVLVRSDLPEDVAYLLAWCMQNRSDSLLAWYRQRPGHRSPINWPFVPKDVATTAIALHDGASACYHDLGIL